MKKCLNCSHIITSIETICPYCGSDVLSTLDSMNLSTNTTGESISDDTMESIFDGGEYSNDGKEFVKYWETGRRQHYYSVKQGTEIINENAFTCEGTPGDGVWDSDDALSYIDLPDSLIEIAEGAFRYCFYLTHITIPDTVTRIGPFAFEDCQALERIRVPSGVNEIEPGTFLNCFSLRYVDILEGVKIIAEDAFKGAAISYIRIPSSIRRIHKDAFTPGIIRSPGLIVELNYTAEQLDELFDSCPDGGLPFCSSPLEGIASPSIVLFVPRSFILAYRQYFPSNQIVSR